MKYKTILFDLDGTLTRSEAGITRSALYAAEKMGFTGYTKEQLMTFIGPPLHHSFQRVMGMTSEQADQAIVYYRERFSTVGWAENEVYEGIPSLLRSLKMNGAKIAMATAKPQVFAEKIAQKFGFAPYLDALIGPMPMTSGATPVVATERILAIMGAPTSRAFSSDIRSTPEAASFIPEAFPAVTFPSSLKLGFNFASASTDAPLLGYSSVSKV